jgi:ribosome-binding ATPase YchF (GTP1/OBG family)
VGSEGRCGETLWLQTLGKRLESEKILAEERAILRIIIDKLNQGISAAEIKLADKEMTYAKSLNLLTLKKQLLVANIDEDEIIQPAKKIAGSEVLSISAKFESDLNEYKWVDQQKILKDLGLKKTAKEQVIKAAYQALDTITFYTIAKKKEARAWLLPRNSSALQASGKIHTDFAKHFVKAEQISAEELIKIGSWSQAHHLGKIILHGKDYQVQNGDVLEFKVGLK